MLRDLVEYAIHQLVDYPDRVTVGMKEDGNLKVFQITVDARDRGKVIGKDGYTIKALRAFLAVIAPNNIRIMIDLVQAA